MLLGVVCRDSCSWLNVLSSILLSSIDRGGCDPDLIGVLLEGVEIPDAEAVLVLDSFSAAVSFWSLNPADS